MARIARAIAAGFPHHVVQRGNNREKAFIDDEDRKKYRELLKKYSRKGMPGPLSKVLLDATGRDVQLSRMETRVDYCEKVTTI